MASNRMPVHMPEMEAHYFKARRAAIETSPTEATPNPEAEIAQLKERVAMLQMQLLVKQRSFFTDNLTMTNAQLSLSSSIIINNIESGGRALKDQLTNLLNDCSALTQKCTFSVGGGVTGFWLHDPTLTENDGKLSRRILGIRFQVMTCARFLQPYYVLLVVNDAGTGQAPQIYRHSVPESVPLHAIAQRHLPPGPTRGRYRRLGDFVFILRHELIQHHSRLANIGEWRRTLWVGAAQERPQSNEPQLPQAARIINMGTADPEAKQIQVEWADGRFGRLIADNNGIMRDAAIIKPDGTRDHELERLILGGGGGAGVRMEDVARRLGGNSQ